MNQELFKCDLSLETFFTPGPGANIVTRPVIPRGDGQPVYMRGEMGMKEDGKPRAMVAHNTTHIDVPLHFIEGGADLDDVLNNPEYGINRPMLTRVLDLSKWPDARQCREWNGIRYCEKVLEEMLPPAELLRQYDALLVLTGFGAIMRQDSESFLPDSEGFFHMPSLTVEVAQRVAEAELSLLAIDGPTLEYQTQGIPYRMSSSVHPILLGNDPPVLILEGVAGDRVEPQIGYIPEEGMLEVIPRRANAKGADAAQARVFLSFYKGADQRQQLEELIRIVSPQQLFG
ncbi:MAG: cyclase family protein [SAR324 cluster bacterium]|nr:cyclase family protein [SAR324 cluster bacterium]